MTDANIAAEHMPLGVSAARSTSCSKPAGLGERLLFFFHVPKTGGETVRYTFLRTFGHERVIHLGEKRGKSFLVDAISAQKFRLPSGAQNGAHYNSHIVGHVASLSIIEGRAAAYHKACFWRHPADWFLSYYNWRNRRDKDRQKRPYSFSEFVKSFSCNPMCQDFLLYCGDVPGLRYFFESDRRKFERALALANKFDLFADISRVDDYLNSKGLASEEGIEYRNRIPRSEKTLKSLDVETRRRLELLNPVDYYIYRIALGVNRDEAITEAKDTLADSFQFRDLVRLIVRPYYRFKVKFVPFFKLPWHL